MPRTTTQWTVSLPPALSQVAEKLARKQHRTRSELVREALRAYIAHEQEMFASRLKMARKLDELGIKTLADVERLIDEGRK